MLKVKNLERCTRSVLFGINSVIWTHLPMKQVHTKIENKELQYDTCNAVKRSKKLEILRLDADRHHLNNNLSIVDCTMKDLCGLRCVSTRKGLYH
jgi:hypothetical protein